MKKIKIGVFGCGRGAAYYNSILMNNGEIVAVCDFLEEKMLKSVECLENKPACYTDFEEFIKHDMDAVFLANYFHEHAPYAIRFLEKGVHVLSECTPNGTMAEGVALVRAAEKSNAFYMLAENYPFMKFNQEMRRVYKGGTLGKFLYGEGEYNHPSNMADTNNTKALRPFSKHWRNYNPITYYVTHSLAPLMYITGAMPKRISVLPVYYDKDTNEKNYPYGRMVGDRVAIFNCLNDDDSVYRFSASSGYGGHHNSYRICGTKGQIENVRGGEGKVMLRYNDWEIPEGAEERNYYDPEWPKELKELIEKTGHGGGDFFVMREFFSCIRENRRPEMDVYFATRCSSVGILGFRSALENGIPYDIPDFRLEEDRRKYENDTLSPFYYPDGREPTMQCCTNPDYRPTEYQYSEYLKLVGEAE